MSSAGQHERPFAAMHITMLALAAINMQASLQQVRPFHTHDCVTCPGQHEFVNAKMTLLHNGRNQVILLRLTGL